MVDFRHIDVMFFFSDDDILVGVPLSLLECARELQDAYNAVDKEAYFGLHIDEVNKDMYAYPDLC